MVASVVHGRDWGRVRELGDERLGFVAERYISKYNGATGIEELLCEGQIDPCDYAKVRIRTACIYYYRRVQGAFQLPGSCGMRNGAKRNDQSIPLPAPVTRANFPLTSYDIL